MANRASNSKPVLLNVDELYELEMALNSRISQHYQQVLESQLQWEKVLHIAARKNAESALSKVKRAKNKLLQAGEMIVVQSYDGFII